VILSDNKVQKISDESNNFFKLTDLDGEKYLDSRAAAIELGIAHDHFIGLLKTCVRIIENQAGRIVEKPDQDKSVGIYYLFTENQLLCLNNFLPHNSVSDDFMQKVEATFNNARHGNTQRNEDLPVQEPLIFNDNELQLTDRNGTKLVDSRLVAEQLDIQHKNLLESIAKYQNKIEHKFGQVAFETRPGYNNSVVRFALLTEDQAIAIANLSRNTDEVVDFKLILTELFGKARRTAQQLSNITPEQIAAERKNIVSEVLFELKTTVIPEMLQQYSTGLNSATHLNKSIQQKPDRSQLIRQIALCEKAKGKSTSAARTNLADIRRIRLLQKFIELNEGKKVSQAEVVKKALDLFCENKVYAVN
jgi:phage regulator Rha-like protein